MKIVGPFMSQTTEIVEETLHEVRGDNDHEEGKGGTHLIGYTASRMVAEDMAKGQGVFGAPGYISDVKGVLFHRTDTQILFVRRADFHVIQLLHEDPAVVKARALAKLSPEERVALGL